MICSKIFCFWKTEVKRPLLTGILLSVAALCAGLNTVNVFAAPTPASISITIASGDLEFTVVPGTFNSGSKAVTVSTNNYSGYSMSLTAAGNTTDLIHTVDSSATIPTITLSGNNTSITSSEFSGTEYGYSLNGIDFKPVTNNAEVRTGTSGTDNFNFTVGAIADLSTIPGDYEQTITFAAVTNAPVISVTYAENTADTVTNMPAQDEFTISNDQIVLSSKTPARSGYDFLGWEYESEPGVTVTLQPSDTIDIDSTAANVKTLTAIWDLHCAGICYDKNNASATGVMDDQTAAASSDVNLWASNFSLAGYGFAGWNTKADGTGTSYGPNQTITMPASGRLWLYAMWVAAEQNVTMQTFDKTDSAYANAATGTIIALEDERDNQVYTVAKMADGNWWMIENLRLDFAESANITAANTNNPTAAFMQVANANPIVVDAWCTDRTSESCLDRFNYDTSNSNNSTFTQSGGRYEYGAYYNWYTATAGHGIFAKETGNVAGDICPAGWHLPTGGSNGGEFGTLGNQIGGSGYTAISAAWRSYPNNIVYSGIATSSMFVNRGGTGSYWTATASNYNSEKRTYRTYFFDNDVRIGSDAAADRFNGDSVRCVSNSVTTYSLQYDANNGENAPATQTSADLLRVHTFTISSSEPTRTDYEFAGWSTDPNTTIAEYQPGDDIVVTYVDNPVTLYAIWTTLCDGVCYDANGGTGTVDPHYTTAGSDVLLWTTKFERAGYGLAGWNTEADGAGTYYGLNETVTMPANNSLYLYAQWVAAEQNVTLQTFDKTAATYANAATGTIIALEDERDGQIYAVAKLEDGNWWMIENLRLNISDANTTITAVNTNNPTSDFVTAAAAKPAAPSTWCKESSAACDNKIAYNTTNTTNANDSAARREYGNYYNWYTATAGHGTYEMTSGAVAGDICPSGWHLPTGRSNGEFYHLNYVLNNNANVTNATASNILRAYPNNFLYSGNAASLGERGKSGSYWTATVYSNNGAYRFNLNNTNVIPGNNSANKYHGYSVRCVANEPRTYTLTYDANGGTNAPAADTATTVGAQNFTITSAEPTRTYYEFLGWSTDWAANVAEYEAGDTFSTTTTSNTLYAIWYRECEGICYDSNGGNGTTPLVQSATAGNDVTLEASNFSRSGYGFVGWNTRIDGAGTTYSPNQTITMPASGELWLYAMWVASSGNLQNFNCDSLSIGDVAALTDTRDNQTYAVSRLADDKCWMIENLRFDISTHGDQITTTNTNNPDSGFITAAAAKPASSDTWCTDNNAACTNQIVYNNGNLNNANNDSRYDYGVYYNWYTATAGNGVFAMNSGNAAGDICPAGWHLPTGTGSGELGLLSNALGGRQNAGVALSMDPITTPTGAEISEALRGYQNNFVYSGYYEDSSVRNLGSEGDYWSSTADGNNNSRYLNFFDTQTHPGVISHSRYGGYTVRCVADYVTVTFNANGGTLNGNVTEEVSVAKNQAFGNLLPTSGFKRFNKVFDGWNTAADGNGTAIDTNTVPTNGDTYYAQWRDTTFPTIWHQDGACTFNGRNGVISGSECSDYAGLKFIDTGIALYDATNHDKDYEIGFTIEHYVDTEQDWGKQETLVNTKLEGSGFPGLVFRRNAEKLELASRRTSSANSTRVITSSEYDFNNLTVRIVRRKNAQDKWSIWYSFNDEPLVQLNDLSTFNPVFDLNVWFGAYPLDEAATTAQRYLTGRLSNMYIRLGDYEEY